MSSKLSEKQHVLKKLSLKVGDRVEWLLSGQRAIVLDLNPQTKRSYCLEIVWERYTRPFTTAYHCMPVENHSEFRQFLIHEVVLAPIQLTLEEKLTHCCEQVRLAAANPDGVKYNATQYRRRARASVGL